MIQAPTAGPAVGAPAISARGLSKRFGQVAALDGVDLAVAAGTVVGIAGPHRAGKSTLVHLLAGLARPTAGSIEVAGRPVGGRAGLDARGRIGVVLEGAPAFGWMTPREALGFAATLADVPKAEIPGRVDATLERVGLRGGADDRIEGHGSEVRRWLALGQALVAGPDVLLVDEAPAAFEPTGRRRVRTLLDELRGTTTVVVTTRHLADVEGICDRLVILGAGRALADGPAAEVISRVAPAVFVVDADRSARVALEGLAARLRGEPWVADAAVVGASLRIVASDEARAATDLPRAIGAAGIGIIAFRRERPPLDDVVAAIQGGRA